MNKKIVIPLVAILSLGMVLAVAGVVFHTTDVTLNVEEARESADVAVTLHCFSGESDVWTTSITNKAEVPLKAQLTFEETSNPDGVTYTTTAPIIVDLKADDETTQDVSVTCDEITNAGTVTGILHYIPYKE